MKFKKILSLAFCLVLLATAGCSPDNPPAPTEPSAEDPTAAPTEPPLSPEDAYDVAFQLPVTEQDLSKVNPGAYLATDGLGRELSGVGSTYSSTLLEGTVPARQQDRFVGIFYSDWHHELSRNNAPRNVTEIMAKFETEEEREAVKHDFKNKAWKSVTGYHFWDEPIYGYYSTIDTYVLRRQAELLADAGVDCVIFDNTNGAYTWKTSYEAILDTWTQARKEGVNTPKIVFMLNFGPLTETAVQLREIYRTVYKKDEYKDLFFYWDGKPLILGYKSALDLSVDLDKEIYDFFTWKMNDASYFHDEKTSDYWGWLSTYPQCKYVDKNGNVEQITVGVAQNADYKRNVITAMSGTNVMGRSYAKGNYSYNAVLNGKETSISSSTENSKFYGINFQQQWDYAISLNPKFIFVTGWNEWVAMRMETWAGDPTLTNCLVDQYDTEYSRDCEPSAGVMKDYYYYQLCENIRRYKGVSDGTVVSPKKSITIEGRISQWTDVPGYATYVNTAWVRSKENGSNGYGGKKYKNETKRNDIVNVKTAYDDEYVYFYADCADVITPSDGDGWMRLFLNTGITDNAWEGFEYVVNRNSPADGKHATVERSKGGWEWEACGTADLNVNKNVIQLRIPRSALGLEGSGAPQGFTYKWCDNNLFGDNEGNIMNLYLDGEAAPGARFAFVFRGE